MKNNVFMGANVRRVTSFYLAVASKFIMIFWFTMMLVEMRLRRSLYTNFGEIREYEITFAQYSHDYDFYKTEKLVGDFLLNV